MPSPGVRDHAVPSSRAPIPKLRGSVRRDGDVLVINVDGPPSRRRAGAMVLAAVVAIGALVWVGSALRGEDVTVMSSSVTRADPFTVDTSSTEASTTTVDPGTTTTIPQPINTVEPDASETSVPATTLPGTNPPAVVTVESPVEPVSPSTTAPKATPKKKKRSTSPSTTAPEPFPPGFDLPAGFYLPPGYVPDTTVPAPTPVIDVTAP